MAVVERDLLGRWDLVDTYVEAPDGKRTPLLGENPRGLIHYGPDHTVIAMLAGSDLSLPEDPVPDAAAAQAWAGFFAYQGTWALSGSRVRHTIHLSHDPRLIGATLERDIVWEHGVLKFSGPHPNSGPDHRVIILWRRP